MGAGGDGGMIAAVKLFHIAALSIWCAGLIALPLLLAKHEAGDEQEDYARLRMLTHLAYVRVVTPAAVIAITLGSALVFLRGVFVPWMFAKLVVVGVLVLLHAWIGHVTVTIGERRGGYTPRRAWPFVALALAAMLVILVLVLGKPVLGDGLAPGWLVAPRGQPLPVDEVPM
ncbi:CopD family protein [Sphingomonas sp. CJ20]